MSIETCRGRVTSGEKVVFEDIEVWLNIVPEERSWHGGLTPPKIMDLMSLGKCQLELTDGRRGEMLFDHYTPGQSATFQGTGPFA